MKFAHEFQAALIREGFPPHWVNSAVPYGQLKKIIKKVTIELRDLGLDSSTLSQLVSEADPNSPSEIGENGVAFQYDFDGDKTLFQPKLTLLLRDGLAVDATLSPDTREFLQKLVSQQRPEHLNSANEERLIPVMTNESLAISSLDGSSRDSGQLVQRVEIPLTFDAEFFTRLQAEVATLDTLQAGEQTALTEQIVSLSKDITSLTKPSRFNKTDLYRWRELFEIYLQAMVFFSTHEKDRGTRDSSTAAKQLQWFQAEVVKRNIVESFKLPASRQALDKFIKINVTLLRSIKFQEINQTAISKILKKFDKRTQLGAKRKFPKLIQSSSAMSQTIAKAVCSQLTEDLVRKVPQLDDNLCPICFTIAWRPVRMKCEHVLCISCAVTLQRKRERKCPLCRDDVIMKADADNIDPELERYLEKYFPKEAREKRIAVETERGKELFGHAYKHPSEQKCSLM